MDEEKEFSLDYFDEAFEEPMNLVPSRVDPLSSSLDLGAFSGEPQDTGNYSSSKHAIIDSLLQGNQDLVFTVDNHAAEIAEPFKAAPSTLRITSQDKADETVVLAVKESVPGPKLGSVVENQLSEQSSMLDEEIPIEMPLVTVTESMISADKDDAASAGVKIEPGSNGNEKGQLGDTTRPSFFELSPTAEGLREVFDTAMDNSSNASESKFSEGSNQSTKDVSEELKVSASMKKKTIQTQDFCENIDKVTDTVKVSETTAQDNEFTKTISRQERAGSEEIEERPAGSPPAAAVDLLEEITTEDKVTTCIVASCRHYKNTKADHVFPFPDPVMQFALRKQWLKKINEYCGKTIVLTGVALLKTKQAGVCNQHFVQEDFISGWLAYPGKGIKYELKPQAVPSIFLNPTDYIQKPQPPKQLVASKPVRQYATKTVEPAKKKLPVSVAGYKPSGPSIDSVDPGIDIESSTTSSGMGKRNRSELGLGDLSEDGGKSNAKKSKPNDSSAQKSESLSSNTDSDEDFVPHKKPHGTVAYMSGKVTKSAYPAGTKLEPLRKKAATTWTRNLTPAAVARPQVASVNSRPVVPTAVQAPRVVLQRPEQMQNQVFMLQTTSSDGKVTSQPYLLTNAVGRPQLSQFVPRQQNMTRTVGPRTLVTTQVRSQMRATAPNARAASKVNSALAPTLVIPAPPIAPTHTEIQLAPVVASSSSASAWKNSRAPCRAVGVQVGTGDLEDGWDDDEIKDLMREAHEEILELKYALETTELELTVEKTKVTHLEARVIAWIREHFSKMDLETERIEVLDQLANYYLEAARRVDDPRKSSLAELELFRANYSRSQKEAESYRQQIIELQNNSARQVDTLQQQKQKQERESQEVIASLRRQLSEAITAKSAAEYELRVLLGGKASAGPPPSTGTKARGPRKPRQSSAAKAATPIVTSPSKTSAPVTTAAVTPTQPPKPPVQYVNPHLVNAPSTSGNTTSISITRAPTQPAPVTASPAPRKRGRPAKDSQERTGEIDGLPVPSPKKSGTRESSVERAVRYLMSL